MGKAILFLLALVVVAAIGLVGYAYIGPILGADFDPPREEIRQPVTLSPTDDG